MATTVEALLSNLRSRGVMFKVEGGRLWARPTGRLTEEEVQEIRRHRPEIMRLLADGLSTWRKLPPDEIPPGLPTDREWWEQPIAFPERPEPEATIEDLRFRATVTLPLAQQKREQHGLYQNAVFAWLVDEARLRTEYPSFTACVCGGQSVDSPVVCEACQGGR